ncbi:MAG: hypothetical protein Ta2B_21210 [Termitinemataceae bacterium]|nr:MAG: hypothetical protein Ta2B_21210 [Termitinemataceae bacterium]
MALQPLDLQLLFSQLDTISKEVSSQKEGAALKKSIDNLRTDQLHEIKDKAVQETKDEGLEKLSDEKQKDLTRKNPKQSQGKTVALKNKTADTKSLHTVKDPDIGNYIDFSG